MIKKRDKNALVKFDDHRRKPRISWFKEAEEIQDPEKAAEIIKRCENIIKTKKKGILNVAICQGELVN